MTQVFTGTGLGLQGSSIGQLGYYGPKGTAGLGQGGGSMYVNAANGNVVLKQSDGFLADFGIGLDLFQTYNSRGHGEWRFNLDSKLECEGVANAAGSVVCRHDEDGHVSRFIYDEPQHQYRAADGSTARLTYDAAGWHYREGSGQTTTDYTLSGQLSRIHDSDGHELCFSYQNGQLVSVMDNRNHQSVTWTLSQGYISDVTFQSEGQIVHQLHYDYDAQHRLSRVSRDLGEGKTYWVAYDYVGDSHLISDIRQADGTTLHLDYDAEGRIKHMVDGAGRETSYVYEDGKTTVINGLGERWTYFFDEDARLIGIEGPEQYRVRYHYDGQHLDAVTQGSQRWQFVYNEAGDCIRVEDPSGEITLREYDSEHRLLSETRYQTFDNNHNPIKPQTSRWAYDAQGHLRFEVTADGTVTEHRYDANGCRISSRCYLSAQWREANASLDALVLWANAQAQDAVSLIDYQYDWRGALSQEIHYTTVNADGVGVITADTFRTYSRYDAAGRCVEKSVMTATGLSTTHYFYDDLGRLLKTVDNQQHTQTITYDDAHQCILKTDPNGLQTLSVYDKSGLLLSVQRLNAQHDFGTVSYRYDAAGRLIAETDVDGQTRHLFYDAQGRLQASLSKNGQVTEYRYNIDGDCILTHQYQQTLSPQQRANLGQNFAAIRPQLSAQDRISQVVYNDYHQMAYQVDAEGAVIAYRYDAEGRVIAKTAYANRLSGFKSDEPLTIADMSLVSSQHDREMTYYYDALGRLQAEVNGEGAATLYRYDAQGHLIETIRYANKVTTARSGDWAIDTPAPHAYKDIHTYSIYNAAGLKIADLDAADYLTEYLYDARGLLTESIAYYTAVKLPIKGTGQAALEAIRPKSDKNDHHTTLRYNDLGQKIEEQTHTGLVTTYAYDEQGQIISQTSMDKRTHEIRQQRHRYDALGRVTQSLDAIGAQRLQQSTLSEEDIESIWQQHSIRYTYDAAGRVLTETNALNQTTRYFYNEEGLLAYRLSADGAVTETRYNAFQQVETSIRYSAYCLLDEAMLTTQALQQYLNAHADAQVDEVTHYAYNNLGLLVSQQKSQGSVTTTTYNAFGELEQATQQLGLNLSTLTKYDYDRRGLLLERTDDVGGIHQTARMQYDTWGRVDKTWDGRQGEIAYQLSKRGEVVLTIDQNQTITSKHYDAFSRILTSQGKTFSLYRFDDVQQTLTLLQMGKAATVVTQFNAFGDKLSITDGNQQTTSYQYDAKGQLIHIDVPLHSSTDYTYDAAGHLMFQDNAGLRPVRYTYDAEGHILTKTVDPDGLNIETRFTYDGIGRQLQIIEAGRCTQMRYDNRGNLVQIQIDPDGLNVLTTRVYDDRNLLLREVVHNPQGIDKVTAYEWDTLGRCIATTIDPDGLALKTTYAYDQNDNLVCQTDPNDHATHYIYSATNQIQYRIDARGVVTEHRYDNQGNTVRTITYAKAIEVRSQYDASVVVSQLQSDVNADHALYFVYDAYNRLSLSFDSLGYATRYGYDFNDNLLYQTVYATPCDLRYLNLNGYAFPPASTLDRTTYFAYDGLNRERYRVDNKGRVTESHYDAIGQLIKQTRYTNPLGLTDKNFTVERIQANLKADPTHDESIRYTYDNAGRLTRQASAGGSITAWHYDAAGKPIESRQYATLLTVQQLQEDDWFIHLRESQDDRVTHTVYDAAQREVYRISSTGHVVERRYDAVGNILQEIKHGQKPTILFYSLEEIHQALAQNNQHATDFAYDAAGRLLQKREGTQTTRYTYDNNNNVASKIEANQAEWHYRYDASNQLIETIEPATLIKTLSQGQWVDELKAVVTQNRYDSFGNLITVIRDVGGTNQTVHYTYDANNHKSQAIYPDVMVNNAGKEASNQRQESLQTLTETWFYDAFGNVVETRDRSGHARHWIYDNTGLLTYAIDAEGGLTEYRYDAFGSVCEKITYAERLSLSSLAGYSPQAIASARRLSEYDRHEQYRYDKDHHLLETQKDRLNAYDSQATKYLYLKPTTRLTYNAFGEVVATAVQLNELDFAVTQTTFNQDGLKIATLDAEGYLTTYAYDDFGQLAEEIQYAERAVDGKPKPSAKDRKMTLTYDALGQLTSKTLKQVTYQRLTGNGSRYENVTEDLTSRYAYDVMGHLVATTDAQGHTAYTYYDALGRLTAKTGAEVASGRALTTYLYDALGNLIESRQWARGAKEASQSGYVLQGVSAADITIQNRYDADGHVLQQIDGTGHQVNYSYDANGNIARSWQTLSQADKTVVIQDKRYTYDADNRLIETAMIKANGQRATDNAQYNAFGEVIRKGIDGTYATQIDYDLCGRVWRSNTQGFFQIYVYDMANNITQIVTSSNALDSSVDHKGLDLSKDIFETASSYDLDVWAYALQRQDTVYDALGHVVLQKKSARLNIESYKNKDSLEQATQIQQVDRWGNVLLHTSARGYTTRYDYNALDKLVEQILPEVSVVDEQGVARLLHPVIHYAYDALGRAIAMTDANGHTAAKVLDANGHITQEIDALGSHRDKTYNVLDQMTSSTNERGIVTAYTYDEANRLLSVTVGDKAQTYRYDGAGQLIAQADTLGNNTAYFYDELGHQVKTSHSGISGVTQYQYDDAGHKIAEQDAKGNKMTWRYDANGRLVAHTDLGGHQTEYTYNRNGLLLTESSTSGKKITYLYFSDGEIQEYYDAKLGETLFYDYDVEGNVLSKLSSQMSDWKVETDYYQYDALGRLAQVRRADQATARQFPSADKAVLSIDYEYDAVGNIRDTKVAARSGDLPQVQHTDYFRYDANNRMVLNKGVLQNGNIAISASQGSELSYDASGNIATARQYEAGAWASYNYRYTMDNQVDRVQKNGVDYQSKRYSGGLLQEEMLYDTKGHATQRNQMRYEAGRLKAMDTNDGSGARVSSTAYRYDDVGNILELKSTMTSGVTQTHLYDYELWDAYQQKTDRLTISVPGRSSIAGKSERIYDMNGQLQDAIDTQAGSGVVTKTHYLYSGIDGVRARKDANGQISYLTVAGKTIGSLNTDTKKTQSLEVYGGFTPIGSRDQSAPGKGFANSGPRKAGSTQDFHNNGAQSAETDGAMPVSPDSNLGTYTLQAGDTLEQVALQVFGDSSLWYLIADANGITDRSAHAGEKGSQLHVGQRLNIPHSANGQHFTSQTHKVISSQDVIGDLSPSVSSSVFNAAPAHKKHHAIWKKIGAVVSVVAAAIATVLSAGVLAAFAGVASVGLGGLISTGLAVLGGTTSLMLPTSMGVGLAAGFIGSVAGQGVANAFRLQKGIDLKGALITGLATAATAGLGKVLSGTSAYTTIREGMDKASPDIFNITNATEMMERDALGQGINLAFAHHQHFDWMELGVSAATAGLMGGKPVRQFNQAINEEFGAPGSFISSEVQAFATGGATSAATGNHFDATQVLTNNLGSALGSSLMESAVTHFSPSNMSPIEEDTASYSPIPQEDNGYSPIPEGTYDRFHQEAAMQNISSDPTNSAWNTLGDDILNYGTKLFGSLTGGAGAPSVNTEQLGSMLGVAGEVAYGDGIRFEGKGALVGGNIIYQVSPYRFTEALNSQMNLKGNSSPKYWVGGSKLWANASREQVSASMNVDQLLSDPVKKLQFMDLHYQEGISVEDLDLLLKNKGVLDGMGASFLKASEANNINPLYLVSHALLETQNGKSQLAQYNNFFGLGAIDGHALAGGIKFAGRSGWSTPELGIMGGAKLISQKWINTASGSQNTLYGMRWNPMNPGKNPQYATDIGWANKQTKIIYDQVSKIQQVKPSYMPLLIVPKYR